MLLKAGTYRFNDVLSDYSHLVTPQYINYTVPIISNGDTYNAYCSKVSFDQRWTEMGETACLGVYVNSFSNAPETPVNRSYAMYLPSQGWMKQYFGDDCNLWVLPTDTEVDDTFGTWYISNTNYNEVNAEDTIYTEKSSWYKSVADAIRNKKGTSAPILRDDFASEIESISVGEEVAEYDGTVVIEKPINWGTRKFKETVEAVGSIELNEEGSINSYDKELLDEYGFEIEPTNFGGGQYALKLSCAFDVTYNGVVQKGIIIKIENEGQLNITVIPLDVFDLSFNVLSTSNSTVDEWLLANTEGVSE